MSRVGRAAAPDLGGKKKTTPGARLSVVTAQAQRPRALFTLGSFPLLGRAILTARSRLTSVFVRSTHSFGAKLEVGILMLVPGNDAQANLAATLGRQRDDATVVARGVDELPIALYRSVLEEPL